MFIWEGVLFRTDWQNSVDVQTGYQHCTALMRIRLNYGRLSGVFTGRNVIVRMMGGAPTRLRVPALARLKTCWSSQGCQTVTSSQTGISKDMFWPVSQDTLARKAC